MKYRCKICGQIVDIKEGEKCPICGAKFENLEPVVENNNSSPQVNNQNQSNNNNSTTSSNTNNSTNDNATSSSPTYIGVPNPNDFYYSYHHGKIEYSTMDACLNSAIDISLKDTIDILNTNCIDVMDGAGNLLGIYLYINCSSGNCDKYK